MAVKERIFLFHGNDSNASSVALKRWEQVFLEKYGFANRYRIDADEYDPNQLAERLRETLDSRSLFESEPVLCTVRRTTSHDKGARVGKQTDALIESLEAVLRKSDLSVTVAVWEDCLLTEKHPLLTWFRKMEPEKRVAIRTFTVPTSYTVKKVISEYCTHNNHSIEPEALAWLSSRYQDIEREQRLVGKIKAAEPLIRDWRSWWLYQTLDVAMLQSERDVITLKSCERAVAWEGASVSVFEIVNALKARQWAKARSYLRRWESSEQEDGAYFGLYTLLERQYRQYGGPEGSLGLKRLGEVEIIAKNGLIPHPILSDMLVLRLGQASKGIDRPIVPYRKLWIASLARS